MFRFGGNGINYTSKLTQDNAVTIDDLVDIYFEIYTHGYYSAFSANIKRSSWHSPLKVLEIVLLALHTPQS